MTNTLEQGTTAAFQRIDEPREALDGWAQALEVALRHRDAVAVGDLFQPTAVFRDLLALSWDFRNASGRDNIAELLTGAGSVAPLTVKVEPGAEIFHSGDSIRAAAWTFLAFTTQEGSGNGYVRIVREDDGAWRASAAVLMLAELDAVSEQTGHNRPEGRVHGPVQDRVGWLESLDPEFEQSEPPVVIIGAGHNGLILAARLRALGIRSLIIETNARVGDNWRKRYTSLALHTPISADEFPYLPYPAIWSKFTPKDKLSGFMESYAQLLELNVWTSSRAENIHFNEVAQRWTLDVVRPDGSRRHLTPEHLVLATGNNAEAIRPQLPGQEEFGGTTIHAVDYRGWKPWAGKKVVVVGTGVSGHDIAQDLAEHGVHVTMIQRSPTVVLNISTVHSTLYGNYTSGKYTTEQSDLINSSTAFGLLPPAGPAQVAAAAELDKDLLAGLESAGFRLSEGPNGQGVLGLIYGENTTGYYYNAGASELIADGSIALRHGSVSGLNATGIVLDDCQEIEADLVVFATGYRGVPTAVRNLLGDEYADEFATVADIGADNEFGRLWRRSGRDRLWFQYSISIGDSRFYSKLLSLQIAAVESGIISAEQR